jgi:hypothetical protein
MKNEQTKCFAISKKEIVTDSRNDCLIIMTFIFLIILLSSCAHYYYVPNSQNVPLFQEKNEYRISGAYGAGNQFDPMRTEAMEIQMAYSVTDKIGIMTNFMSVKGENLGEGYGKGNYLEGALGYFKPIKEWGVFEIYGGFGGGKQHHEYYNTSDKLIGSSNLSSVRIYLQPSFGLTYNAFDIALSTRVCRLSFDNINSKELGNSASNYEDERSELYALSNKSHFFIEPALTLRGGWKNIKVQYQRLFSSYLNKPKLSFGEEDHGSIGLYITIAERYR